ncbi:MULTISPECIES: heavy metal-responsive transcriptional regulator [Nocardioides]|jgi:DNA-binding transcriptional MerR regulator|uniref:Heavy metal-responsive transcriptional regulator n=2 Tax=Nocardioides TaxID=1839 RepID=A0A5C4VPA9_9ACTN|nr:MULTISPECIES: heavy metal-responsive transcriptional regulator [Nocardioides]NYD41063.1 DNA-binding transcriptional MerR regulator [Nocardioides panaciterrulae]TNM37713.1 heavy metal-responsive transcriptional regulator [Nocardioides albidus]HET7328632.1 heavy metal-responsive transcriptional regulator [Nocardioidaceae bacterium]HET7734627.1 heavy metal-responsive transcriptional regulator [Nocardioidaceae bacterium]
MRIGELAEASGTTAKTLRFYEEQGLLPAAERTPAGYRDYTPDAVGRIDFIHRGQAAGLTLAQVRQILDIRDDGQAPCGHVQDLLDSRLADLDEQIAQLVALRETITQLRDQAATVEPETCSPDQVCRYL